MENVCGTVDNKFSEANARFDAPEPARCLVVLDALGTATASTGALRSLVYEIR
jgi:hypothetical protein